MAIRRNVYRVELADGRIFDELRIWQADNTRYEDNRDRLKLGEPKTDPFNYLSYVTWCALTRLGELDRGMPFDAFKTACVDIEPLDTEKVRPTVPAVGAG